MYRIRINRDLCIGCLTCVTACVVSHETESGDARNRVVIDSETTPAPIFCRHCNKPECVYTCMTGAMHKNPETGFVEYNKEQCASCYMCIMSCPYGILKYDSIRHKEIISAICASTEARTERHRSPCVSRSVPCTRLPLRR